MTSMSFPVSFTDSIFLNLEKNPKTENAFPSDEVLWYNSVLFILDDLKDKIDLPETSYNFPKKDLIVSKLNEVKSICAYGAKNFLQSVGYIELFGAFGTLVDNYENGKISDNALSKGLDNLFKIESLN